MDSEGNILMLEKAAAGYDNVIHCLIEYEIGRNRCGVVTKERVLELVGCISAQPHLFYIIIFGKFRIAPMGVRGVSIVTVVSQATAAIIGLYILIIRNGMIKGFTKKTYISVDKRQIADVFRTGLSSSAEFIFWQLAAIILTRAILTFGETAFAAHQPGMQAESISYIPAAGFGVVSNALVGQALGSKNKEIARIYFRQIMKSELGITAFV